MRRLVIPLLATVLLLMPALPAHGQITHRLLLGINLASSDIGADSGFGPDIPSISRLSLGLLTDVPMSERLGLQFGARYEHKGGVFQVGELGKGAMKLDYVAFTALGKVKLPQMGSRVSPHLLLGPALTLETGCRVIGKAGAGVSSLQVGKSCFEGAGLDRPTFDLGWAGGAGVEVRLFKNFNVTVDFLFTRGLLDTR